MTKEEYQAHINSDYWRRLRGKAWHRSGGICERCGWKTELPAQNLHHKSYAKVGAETLDDVTYVCRGCHLWEHNPTTAIDPLKATPEQVKELAKLPASSRGYWPRGGY